MHRIDTKTAQKDKFGAGKNGFTRGNPQTGTPATDLDDDYFDMLQEELCSVVEASGASLEKARHDQLLTALRALLLSRKNPFGDIKSDGTVKTALENLGIKDASTTQVGLVRLTSSRVSGAEDIAATANAVAQNYTDIKSLQNKTQDSTTTQKGIVQLTSSRVSESETLAATAKAAAMNYADIVALQGKTNDATTTNKGIIRVSDSRTST
ncbi:hypothetical protein IAU94_004531, partial [Escherichia coli]|nr:hypothetical protein [Escherichia coli]EGD1013718.1 hypothetical protein [Escherichia coli]EIE8234304.1 tail fiber protein [Escherichia coli]HCN9184663.1 tail fiber protein [Escherichia coli]